MSTAKPKGARRGGSGRKARGEGAGSVRQRSEGSWEGRYRVQGQRFSVFGKNRTEVEAKIRDGLEEARQGINPKGGAETLNEHIAKYLPVLRTNTKKVRSYTRNEELLRCHVQPALGERTLVELLREPELIDTFYAELHARRAHNTVVHVHVALHKCLKQAVNWMKIPSNPADKVMKPQLQRGEQHPLDVEQAEALIEFSKADPLGAFWTAAVTHGFREGELLALRWNELRDLAGKRPTVSVIANLEVGVEDPGDPRKGIEPKPYMLGDPKTAKSRRSVRLCAAAAGRFRQHRDELMARGIVPLPNSFVFDRGDGQPLDADRLIRAWRKVRHQLRLPAATTVHDLRHTAATTLLAKNVNAKIVSEMLGHASIAITLDLYSHVLPSIQEAAIEALDELFGTAA